MWRRGGYPAIPPLSPEGRRPDRAVGSRTQAIEGWRLGLLASPSGLVHPRLIRRWLTRLLRRPEGAVIEPPVTPYSAEHRGIDIGTPIGTPFHAPADGTVSFAGPIAGSLFVSIDHPNGVRTSCSWVSAVSVTKGQTVTAGQVIGLSGHGDRVASRPVLHVSAKFGGRYFDPMLLLVGPELTELIHEGDPAPAPPPEEAGTTPEVLVHPSRSRGSSPDPRLEHDRAETVALRGGESSGARARPRTRSDGARRAAASPNGPGRPGTGSGSRVEGPQVVPGPGSAAVEASGASTRRGRSATARTAKPAARSSDRPRASARPRTIDG